MSVEQLESAILALPPEERQRLALWFEEHRHELLGDTEADDDLTGDQKAEILRRRDLALAHPELLEPWEASRGRARDSMPVEPREANMSVTAEKILREIKALPPEDLREVCQQVIQLAGHLDYGDISDDALTALAAETFALLDKEEADAESR